MYSDEDKYMNDSFERDSDAEIPEVSGSDSDTVNFRPTAKSKYLGYKPTRFTSHNNPYQSDFDVNEASSSDDNGDVVISKTIAQINTKPMNLYDALLTPKANVGGIAEDANSLDSEAELQTDTEAPIEEALEIHIAKEKPVPPELEEIDSDTDSDSDATKKKNAEAEAEAEAEEKPDTKEAPIETSVVAKDEEIVAKTDAPNKKNSSGGGDADKKEKKPKKKPKGVKVAEADIKEELGAIEVNETEVGGDTETNENRADREDYAEKIRELTTSEMKTKLKMVQSLKKKLFNSDLNEEMPCTDSSVFSNVANEFTPTLEEFEKFAQSLHKSYLEENAAGDPMSNCCSARAHSPAEARSDEDGEQTYEGHDLEQFNADFTLGTHTPTSFNTEEYAFHMDLVKNAAAMEKKKASQRKSFSFTNARVREIERENEILLKKILAKRKSNTVPVTSKKFAALPPSTRVTSAAVNRKKQQRQIDIDNMVLKRKLEAINGRKSHL